MVLTPLAQEISGKECDVGLEREDLEREIERLLSSEGEGTKEVFGKIDFEEVEAGWCWKVRCSFPLISCSWLCLDRIDEGND